MCGLFTHRRFPTDVPSTLDKGTARGIILTVKGAECSGLTCRPVKPEIAGSNPVAPAYSKSLWDIKSSLAIEGSLCFGAASRP